MKDLPVPESRAATQLAMWSATSLDLPETTTYEEWSTVGEAIGHIDGAIMWWIGDWRLFGDRHYGSMADQAEAVGVSYDTLNAARWVAERIEVVRRRTTLSWGHHREVASLEPDEQEHWLDECMPEPGDTKPRLSVHDLRRAIKASRARSKRRVQLPAGTFEVIYADPPWRYEFAETDNRAIENQYPTLTADEIADYKDADGRSVLDIRAKDAVLYMWATNPKLEEALMVMGAWGFEYVTNAVWVKDRIGMGYWWRQKHELLLVGKRGDFSPPAESARHDSVIAAPRGAHSAKPEIVYEYIEEAWPVDLVAPRHIEVFARTERPGWASFGDEL